MKDKQLHVFTAEIVNAKFWLAGYVTWGEIIDWTRVPSDHKECGAYVLGRFQGKYRRSSDLIARDALTLDFDHHAQSVPGRLAELGHAAVWHTTYSHAPDDFRCRVLMLTDRPMSGEEYEVAAESMAQKLGIESADRTSFRPAQYMWKPSTQQPDWYRRGVVEGEPVSVQWLLDTYDAELAVSSRTGPDRRARKLKQDPFKLPGLVGAFNRAHEDLDTLIAEFELPYVREGEGRYRYAPARSVAGMGPVVDTPGLFYSHHATDPAGLTAQTAFDLVRAHAFGHLDADAKPNTPIAKLPSTAAMMEYAERDQGTIKEMNRFAVDEFRAGLDPALAELDETGEGDGLGWMEGLSRNRRTAAVLDTVANIDLIALNDPVLKHVRYSELLAGPVTTERFPWDNRRVMSREVISRSDMQQILMYLERVYGFRAPMTRVEQAVIRAADLRPFNPLVEHLESLEWDGVPRMEVCLPAVAQTDYTRAVARRTLIGAVARAYQPGCKVDNSLILYGPEGIGKTRWVGAMGIRPEFTTTLGPVGQKDTLLAMHRAWIVVSDEVESLRRADFDALKSFMTRETDNYRAPYESADRQYPRRCVIWGTTNDPKFLRRQEGNRRFLIVECTTVDESKLAPWYVDQVWAEAVAAYKRGEQWYMTPVEEKLAKAERERFTQDEPLHGRVRDYLEMPVPMDWEAMDPGNRALWFMMNRFSDSEACSRMDVACVQAVWREVLGRERGLPSERDVKRVTEALEAAPGWVSGGVRQTAYGPQQVYVRDPGAGLTLSDLI